jgi:serine/threonine-protein kinase
LIGESIAHYEVTDKLGEGAMGEVYRATDTRLNRGVAIKILSSRVAADPAIVSRLQREAEILASLSHAHIAQIYGIEQAGDSSLALVLELVEGPTLADRLKSGPLPLALTLRVAHQMAAALESAHENGIIHRDLKPENVKLTSGGDVKVLDFGLAKGIEFDATKTGLTADGVVVGTPAYMSPEQVEGQELDRRTDIWSFGCVLYEMLAGCKAVPNKSLGSLFAAITVHDTDFEPLTDAPAQLRRMVRRCLRKDPRLRLRDIGDARVELEEMLAGWSEPVDQPKATAPRRGIALVAAALALGFAVGALLVKRDAPESAEAPVAAVSRYSIAMRAGPTQLQLESPTSLAPPLAVSRDGRTVAFAAADGSGSRQLWVRAADAGNPVPVPGTEGLDWVCFAPDGKRVCITKNGGDTVRWVALASGTIAEIANTAGVRGAAWGDDDRIVFAAFDQGLKQVAATGGKPEPLAKPAPNERDHRWPQMLPNGQDVLFTASMNDGRVEPRILTRATGEVTRIPVQGAAIGYLPGGFLVYTRSHDLWAVRFDLAKRTIIGEPARVVAGIHTVLGTPHVAVSPAGVLVYEPSRPPSPGAELVWVDRSGKTSSVARDKQFEFPRLSPSGTRIATAIHTATANHEIWIYGTERRTGVKVTSGGNYIEPVWSPDEKTIAFASAKGNLYTQRLSDATAKQLVNRPGQQYPLAWLRKDLLIFEEVALGRGLDLLEMNPETGDVRSLLASNDNECAGTLSPDGKWLAYVSDATGSMEVYVRSYPELGLQEPVSTRGGTEPVWSPAGRELFFRNGRDVFVVTIGDKGRPDGEPAKLFDGPFVLGYHQRPAYDVAADGQRLLMIEKGLDLTTGRLDVYLQFEAALESALPREE